MGTSSSKRSSLEQRLASQYAGQESILRAIAAKNKQQRRLLQKQARKQAADRYQSAPLYYPESYAPVPTARSERPPIAQTGKRGQAMFYATSCQNVYSPSLSGLESPSSFLNHPMYLPKDQRFYLNGDVDIDSIEADSENVIPLNVGQHATRRRRRRRPVPAQTAAPIAHYHLPDESSTVSPTPVPLMGSENQMPVSRRLVADRTRRSTRLQLESKQQALQMPVQGRKRQARDQVQQVYEQQTWAGSYLGGSSVARAANTQTPGSQSTTSQYSSQSSSYANLLFMDQVHINSNQRQPDHHSGSTLHNASKQIAPNNHSREIIANRTTYLNNIQLNPQPPIDMSSLIPAHRQRGLAFTEEERKRHQLLGILPAAYQDQQLQIKGVINFIDRCNDDLSKYVYLRHLKDFNERLFYAAVMQNVEKLMPIVYTPTVGLACQNFSQIYMRPRGLFVTARDKGRVASLLANWQERDVRVIVVTDGERILGLGDLGANGMGISIGKLSLYTALAGIPPRNVLPVTIDVGTNNQANLDDPFYIGLRQKRIRGAEYDALIEEFMRAVVERWGRSCLIQFEDFANITAFDLLQRYRDQYCTFNDDIQGTASVCLSGLISATRLTEQRLSDCTFLFYGAGEANIGTAKLLMMAMLDEGVPSETEAKSHIWLVDSKGLVVSSRGDLTEHKRYFAHESPELKDLEQIIDHVRPAAIIGACAQGGAFTESICAKMAAMNKKPIIFALSNPTSKAECTAEQAYRWTKGTCVFASGSPFEPVVYEGKTYITGQGNNVYIFPGVGLAAIAAHVHSIPEETFLVAAKALSDLVTSEDTSVGLIYPRLNRASEVTLSLASRVFEYFYAERLATYRPEPENKMEFLRGIQYDARYSSQE